MIDYFHQVTILHISTGYDVAYLDANRWQQFILTHMKHLKTFDLHHTGCERAYYNNNNPITYHDLVEKFVSPFWIERQWFFAHQHGRRANYFTGYFYSSNPYKYG
jgi:hypothetical protein